jgi:hypothetical protein
MLIGILHQCELLFHVFFFLILKLLPLSLISSLFLTVDHQYAAISISSERRALFFFPKTAEPLNGFKDEASLFISELSVLSESI